MKERRRVSARSLFFGWSRVSVHSIRISSLTPVFGFFQTYLKRTPDSTLFTFWPPAPPERKVSHLISPSLISTSNSSASSNLADILAASASYVGGGNRGQVYVRREGNDKIKFAVGLMKERNEAPMVYDYNTTHLLVLKVDYDKNEVSLFVDPDLNQNEPKADVVVAGEEGALKAGLKAISFRNRSGFKGNIGNFRFARDWAGAIGK